MRLSFFLLPAAFLAFIHAASGQSLLISTLVGRDQLTDAGYLAVDANGTIYLTDEAQDVVEKITPQGAVSVFAGVKGVSGSADGVGAAAHFAGPRGVAVDPAGNVYVADSANNTVRKITPDGRVTTIAGAVRQYGYVDATGSAARFGWLGGLTVDASGVVYVGDLGYRVIRKITPDGVVTTLAGNPGGTNVVTDGTGAGATFFGPWGVALDAGGTLFVADLTAIRRVTPDGTVTTVVPVVAANGVAVDAAGNLLVTTGTTVVKVTAAGASSTLAGLQGGRGFVDGLGSDARFNTVSSVAVDHAGMVYLTDLGNHAVRKGVPAAASAPTILAQPQSQIAAVGQSVTFSVTADAGPPARLYRWYRNDQLLSDALLPSVTFLTDNFAYGTYRVDVYDNVGTVTSVPATLMPPGTSPTARLINLSTRAATTGGTSTLIVGFTTNGSKSVLLRGVGPGLTQFGVAGALAQPRLAVVDVSGMLLATNSGWGGSTTLASAMTQVGAFALAPDSADAALLRTLSSGSYTAQISGVGGTSGVALAEIYDADGASATTRLMNVSSRAFVGTGDAVLVAGFVVAGSGRETLLIRGVGTGLTAYGVPNGLSDQRLTLFNGPTQLLFNEVWNGRPDLAEAFKKVGAFPLSASSGDTAMLVSLPPGAYTAQVIGRTGHTGVALIEVYEVP
jgi:hypothetical protein